MNTFKLATTSRKAITSNGGNYFSFSTKTSNSMEHINTVFILLFWCLVNLFVLSKSPTDIMGIIKFLPLILIFQVVMVNSEAVSMSTCFYKKSCPRLETIVKSITAEFLLRDRTLAGPLLRLHFHDCFVRVKSFFAKKP